MAAVVFPSTTLRVLLLSLSGKKVFLSHLKDRKSISIIKKERKRLFVQRVNTSNDVPPQAGRSSGPLQGDLPANMPPHPMYMPMQMLWWQQMYARHYYMQ